MCKEIPSQKNIPPPPQNYTLLDRHTLITQTPCSSITSGWFVISFPSPWPQSWPPRHPLPKALSRRKGGRSLKSDTQREQSEGTEPEPVTGRYESWLPTIRHKVPSNGAPGLGEAPRPPNHLRMQLEKNMKILLQACIQNVIKPKRFSKSPKPNKTTKERIL